MVRTTQRRSLISKAGRPALALGLALAVAAGVTGCGTGEKAAASSGGITKIRFLFPEYSDKTRSLMQGVVNDFNAANKGKISVSLETAPWDKMHDKLAVSMGSGTAPDVFGFATRWISEFAGLNQLEPVDGYLNGNFKSSFNPALLQAANYHGKTYGVPAAVSARLLFYRTDLFAKAGLSAPKTWDELLAAAVKTAHPPKNYGLGVPASGIEVDTFFDYFLYNNGGDILDANGKSALSSPQSVEALDYLSKLVKNGGSEPKPTGFTREQIIEMFKSGQLSMYPTGPWLNAMIKADAPNLKYGITPFPTNGGNAPKTVAVTDSLGMSSKSKHKAEAWKFIQFMYQKDYRQKFDEVEGMLPELVAVAQSDYFQTPTYKPFIDALSTAKFQPQHPKFERVQQIMTVAVQKVLSGQASAKSALDDATQQINQL